MKKKGLQDHLNMLNAAVGRKYGQTGSYAIGHSHNQCQLYKLTDKGRHAISEYVTATELIRHIKTAIDLLLSEAEGKGEEPMITAPHDLVTEPMIEATRHLLEVRAENEAKLADIDGLCRSVLGRKNLYPAEEFANYSGATDDRIIDRQEMSLMYNDDFNQYRQEINDVAGDLPAVSAVEDFGDILLAALAFEAAIHQAERLLLDLVSVAFGEHIRSTGHVFKTATPSQRHEALNLIIGIVSSHPDFRDPEAVF